MEDSVFSMLKLRASYGTQGNQNVLAPAYGTNPLFVATNLTRDLNYVGSGYNNDAGIGIANLAYPSLMWEEISQLNFGLDFRVFNNKLEGNVDVYRKQTENCIILSQDLSLLDFMIKMVIMVRLEIVVLNCCLSIIFLTNKISNFLYSLMLHTIKWNHFYRWRNQEGNNLTYLPGRKAGEFNLIPYIGVNQSNGNLLFMDRNGNPTENPDLIADRRLTDKSSIPAYQGGLVLTLITKVSS